MAVGLLIRVGTLGDLLEHLDDLVGLSGTLGLDAATWQGKHRRRER